VKIIYLHQYFNTREMSGITRSYEMARRLVRRGHQVHVVTSRRDGASGWFQTRESGIDVSWCSVPYSNHMSYGRRMRAFFEYGLRAGKKAASLEGDVVFATSTPLTIALPAVYVARKRNIPMVFEVRDLWPDAPIAVGALQNPLAISAARWLERFAYRNSVEVVALSPGMKEGVVATGYPADCVTVIPNSCDLDLFDVPAATGSRFRERYPWLGSRPLVAYTGALGLVNGVDYLARLAAAVAPLDPEIRFLVVGEGREEARIRRVAEELGVLDRSFFMLPPMAKSEMPAVLSAADVAVSTVIDEPRLWIHSHNKVFDAFAAGRPLAVNYGGWFAEMIGQTDCGLVLDRHDLAEAAERLVGFLHDHVRLAAARSAARRLARQRFDRDLLADQLEEVLLRAVGSQRKSISKAA
jgi:glycosyltransferase involved in cell wall biosynthesis